MTDIGTMINQSSKNPSEFKTYEELKEKFERVIGGTSTSTAESVAEDLEEVPWANVVTETVASEPVMQSAESTPQVEEDDAMDYFKNLANES